MSMYAKLDGTIWDVLCFLLTRNDSSFFIIRQVKCSFKGPASPQPRYCLSGGGWHTPSVLPGLSEHLLNGIVMDEDEIWKDFPDWEDEDK